MLKKKLFDSSYQGMLKLLSIQNKDGWTLGDTIACYQDAATTQAYVGLLTTLLGKEGVSAKDIYALLKLQTQDGWSFGDTIARNQDAATTQAYVELLTTLLGKEGVSAKDIYALLKLQHNDGWTFGDFIARHQDAATTQAYVELLTTLLGKQDVSAKDIYVLLKLQIQYSWSFGDIIAYHQDAAATQAYLKLLVKAFKIQGDLACDISYLLKPFTAFQNAFLGLIKIHTYFSSCKNKPARRDDFLSFCSTLKGEVNPKLCWELEKCKSSFGHGYFTKRYYGAMKMLSAALTLPQKEKDIIIEKLAEIETLLDKQKTENSVINASTSFFPLEKEPAGTDIELITFEPKPPGKT